MIDPAGEPSLRIPVQGSRISFFSVFIAHFLRLNRKKPGYPGFRSAPFPSGTLRAPPIPCAQAGFHASGGLISLHKSKCRNPASRFRNLVFSSQKCYVVQYVNNHTASWSAFRPPVFSVCTRRAAGDDKLRSLIILRNAFSGYASEGFDLSIFL
jgi:hypothetical protein